MPPSNKPSSTPWSISSKLHALGRKAFPQVHTRDGFVELTKDIPLELNLTPSGLAVGDTLSYKVSDYPPSFDIIPAKSLLSVPWRGGEYCTEDFRSPVDQSVSVAFDCTLTSQCAGNPRWECEQFAAFIRANNVAFDNTSTSVVALARSNDPWRSDKGNVEQIALIQVVGTLITAFATHLPKEIPFSAAPRITAKSLYKFSKYHDLRAGLDILSAIPPLELDGKGLSLIVDLSDIEVNDDKLSNGYRGLINTLYKVSIANGAKLLRVNTTQIGFKCFVDGW